MSDVENTNVDMDELEQFESEVAAASPDDTSSESTAPEGGEQVQAEAKPDEGSLQAAEAADAGQPDAATTPQTGGQEAQAQPDLTAILSQVIVDHRGRQRTVQDLLTSGDYQDAITTAQQFPHIQKLYTEAMKTLRGDQPPQQQPQVPAEFPPVPEGWTRTVDYITKKGPKGEPSLLEKYHKAGYLGSSDEFVELEPKLAASMAIRAHQIDELLRWKAEFAQREAQNHQLQEQTAFRARVDGYLDQIADEESVPKLKTERQDFYKYVIENVDPRADRVTKDTLADLLYAYLRRKDPAAFRQRFAQQPKPNRAAAVGGSGRAAPTAPKTGIAAELDELDHEFNG